MLRGATEGVGRSNYGILPDTFHFTELERRLQRLEDRTEDLPAIRAQADSLSSVVRDLGEELKALRRAIVTAAISFAVSSVLVAVSVLIAIR